MSAEQFVEDGAEAVDIRRDGDLVRMSRRLLGRHIAGGTEHRAAQRQFAVAFNAPREPEIRDRRLAARIEEDITRLQIAMENAALMRVVDGARNFCNDE